MGEDVRCWLRRARVRDDRADDLQNLLRQMFNRRHHAYIASHERTWLTVELVQSLREQSEVYRQLSSKTEGPLPFELGYLRIRDGRLEPVSDVLPDAEPEVVTRMLSEFLEPGAEVLFQGEKNTFGWLLRGVNEIKSLTDVAGPDEASEASSTALE